MARHPLPVLGQGSLRPDGSRIRLHPHEAHGRFTRIRRVVFAVLLVVYVALPFIRIGGRPAVFLDVAHRRFFLFGAAFNAQDFWMVFLFLAGAVLLLVAATAVYGRVWCGYACPQTVFLEGVARRLEGWIEGPASHRRRVDAAWRDGTRPAGVVARKSLKHVVFVVLSLALAHVLLGYFVSFPSLADMVTRSPGEHPSAFAWTMGIALALYLDLAFFREQLCFILCPYGRLQSALMDEDTVVIGYDQPRGEPRGKASDPNAGDCVDCGACVQVCPTGIDIRKGLQMECIACGSCIDACDGVMDKLGRARGLVRYDMARTLERGEPAKRVSRSRLRIYGAAALLWGVGVAFALGSHTDFEANLLRPRTGASFQRSPSADGGPETIRNTLELHLVNKRDEPQRFQLEAQGETPVELPAEVTLGAGESRVVMVVAQRAAPVPAGARTRIFVRGAQDARAVELAFLGPRR